MRNRILIAALALSLAPAAFAGEWTERYFGVGSAGDRGEACGLARDHAQGNSLKACIDRRGKRGDAAYTVKYRGQCRALADDLLEVVCGFDLVLQVEVLLL